MNSEACDPPLNTDQSAPSENNPISYDGQQSMSMSPRVDSGSLDTSNGPSSIITGPHRADVAQVSHTVSTATVNAIRDDTQATANQNADVHDNTTVAEANQQSFTFGPSASDGSAPGTSLSTWAYMFGNVKNTFSRPPPAQQSSPDTSDQHMRKRKRADESMDEELRLQHGLQQYSYLSTPLSPATTSSMTSIAESQLTEQGYNITPTAPTSPIPPMQDVASTVVSMQSTLHELRKSHDVASKEYASLEAQVSTIQANIDQQKSSVDGIVAELHRVTKTNTQMLNAISQQSRDLSEARSWFRQHISHVQGETDTHTLLNERIKQLEGMTNSQKNSLDGIMAELQGMKNLNQHLGSRLEAAKGAKVTNVATSSSSADIVMSDSDFSHPSGGINPNSSHGDPNNSSVGQLPSLAQVLGGSSSMSTKGKENAEPKNLVSTPHSRGGLTPQQNLPPPMNTAMSPPMRIVAIPPQPDFSQPAPIDPTDYTRHGLRLPPLSPANQSGNPRSSLLPPFDYVRVHRLAADRTDGPDIVNRLPRRPATHEQWAEQIFTNPGRPSTTDSSAAASQEFWPQPHPYSNGSSAPYPVSSFSTPPQASSSRRKQYNSTSNKGGSRIRFQDPVSDDDSSDDILKNVVHAFKKYQEKKKRR